MSKAGKAGLNTMQVIFHLGAQRSATTTFQHYMRSHTQALGASGVGFWGPQRLREAGLFEGLYAGPSGRVSDEAIEAAKPRIAKALNVAAARGVRTLVISEENMLGSVKGNIRHRALYPDAETRLRGFVQAMGRPIDKVMLGLRPLDAYWSSALAYGVKRGAAVPEETALEAISGSARSWRDVVCDIAQVVPSAEIELHRYEDFADAPDARLELVLGRNAELPKSTKGLRMNEAPDLSELRAAMMKRGVSPTGLPDGEGRWQPFLPDQAEALAERHADDIFWCIAGAGGVARLIERKTLEEVGMSLPPAARRGHIYDQARRMGQAS